MQKDSLEEVCKSMEESMQIHGESSFRAFRNPLPSLARGCQTYQRWNHGGKALRMARNQGRTPFCELGQRSNQKEQGIQHFRKALRKFRKALRNSSEKHFSCNAANLSSWQGGCENVAGGLRNLASIEFFEISLLSCNFFYLLSIVKAQ